MDDLRRAVPNIVQSPARTGVDRQLREQDVALDLAVTLKRALDPHCLLRPQVESCARRQIRRRERWG